VSDPRAAGDLTRRALLGTAAAAGVASLAVPAGGLASALAGPDGIASRWVGSIDGAATTIAAPGRFALVGVEWAGPRGARIELRTRRPDGRWSRWALASALGHGPDLGLGGVAARGSAGDPAAGAHGGPLFGEAIWTGTADRVQLRADRSVHGVRLHLVSERAPSPALAAAALPRARPILDAGSGQPPIIARSAWARGQAPPRYPAAYGYIKLAFVHHTDTPNGYSRAEVPAMLMSIYRFHRYVRGWNDIGYNFAIDLFGRIWEARAGGIDEPVIGAQAVAYNTVSTGVAVLGTFQGVVPTPAAIAALERLLAWKLSLHGIPGRGHVTVEVDPADAAYTPFPPGAHVSLPRIAGHRDGDSTGCPGDAFYARLPAIRPRVAALAGSPAKLTLAADRTVLVAGAQVLASGRLRRLAGPAIAGAELELQAVTPRRATTLETATTGADGSWSAALALPTSLVLRALHRAAPAAVSDLVLIEVAPALTLSLVSPSPLRVTGTVSPHKPVTIDLYALRTGRRQRLLSSKRVAAAGGRFTAQLRTRHHGRVRVIARTAADAGNAAGASAPVDLTV
jgi:N-acetylmuramoyl-L-alanine amidase